MNDIVPSSGAHAATGRHRVKKFLLRAISASSVLLALPAAHAEMISFDSIGTGPMGNQFTIPLPNFTVTAIDNLGDMDGALAGAVVNGSAPVCFGFDCPTWSNGSYYAALNDSSMKLAGTASQTFQLKSFDASMVANFGVPSGTTGLLRVTGVTANQTTIYEDFSLDARGANGYKFQHFNADNAFGTAQLTALSFSSFSCAAGQACQALAANFGQFAVDNIDTGGVAAAVPEPSSWLMMGLGLAGIVTAARRKKHRVMGRPA